MFKFFGRLFGSEKALDAVVGGAVRGLDALVYTSEEKAQDAARATTEARQMVVAWMAATQGQNLSRRLIALSITGVWLSQIVASQLLNVASVWTSPATSLKLIQSAKIMMAGSVAMGSAVMLILAFYFAAPHMGDIAKAVTGRFARDINKG